MNRVATYRLLFCGLALLIALLVNGGTSAYAQETPPADSSLSSKDTILIPKGEKDTLVVIVRNEPAQGLFRTSGGDTSAEEDSGPPSIADLVSWQKLLWAIIMGIIGYFLIRVMTRSLQFWSEKSAKRRSTLKGVIPMVQIFGWLLIIFIIIEGVFRPPMETLLTVGASLGIAVGFASQDILKNVFAGVVILFDRPFSVGDKVEVGSTYGEVKQIGLRSTRIETADDSLVTVPNAEIMNQMVSNSNSGEENCQVVAEIWLPLDIDTEMVRSISTQSAQVSKFIYLNKPIAVLFFNEVKEGRSLLKMRLKAYVMDIRYEFAFKSEMTEIVIKELIEREVLDPNRLL